MSSLEKRPPPDEKRCAELELCLASDSSELHCKETHVMSLRTPVFTMGRLPRVSTNTAGMFLLCVYPIASMEGSEMQHGMESDQGVEVVPSAELMCPEGWEFPRLTPTETEVMGLLAQGKTNRAIADEMFISVNTVKTHIRSIFQKLGVNTRGSAVRLAAAAGFFDEWSPPVSP